MRPNIDHSQLGLPQVTPGKPVKDLDKLKLVKEVMLEPEHHFVVAGKVGKPAISLLNLGKSAIKGAPSGVRDELRSTPRQLLQRQAARHWPIMQNVDPGEVFAHQT